MPAAATVKKHYRVCNLCEAMCGLEIEHDEKKVLAIRGDKSDPFSQGSICPKGALMGELYEDPDRLRRPLKKTPKGFISISWQEALDIVGERLNAIRAQYGNDAIGLYLGNPTVHNVGALLYISAFKKALRTKNAFSATSMDQLPHHFAALHMFGHGLLLPIPDIDRTDYMIIMGANPVASNGSLMSAAGVQKRLKAIQERGGEYVVIDPRKTETAKGANQHFFIQPGTDVYFLLAVLKIILDTGPKLGHLSSLVKGLSTLREIVDEFTIEQAAALTGIEVASIQAIARQYLNTKRAVIYGRMGLSTQTHGGLCQWLINLINLISGHLDTEGGAMFTKPAIPVVRGKPGRINAGRWKSRVSGLPEYGGELPVVTMAEEITTPGTGQIKALVTHAGNPVLSAPSGHLLEAALPQLDFMVAIDIYLNESSKHADIILPPTTGLEIDHYDLVFNALAVSNNAKFSPALFPPQEGQLHDWQILKALTQRVSKKPMPWTYRWSTPRRLLNAALLTGPYGKLSSIKRFFSGLSLTKVRKARHGIRLGPLQPMLPKALMTKDKKISLCPEPMLSQLKTLKEESQSFKKLAPNEFRLIGRRHLRSNNSWLHNTDKLMRGKNRCTVMLHPTDSARLSLMDEQEVIIRSRVGEIQIPVEITDQVRPGVVSIPHGFGHHRADIKLQVAANSAGVSVNDITDFQRIDPLTGNAAFSGQIVQIISQKPHHV